MNIKDLMREVSVRDVVNGIKSKERVAEHGEVYTPEHIVKEMLDYTGDKSYDLDATFMEPSCGNGNFLVEIIARKLKTAEESENVKLAVFRAYRSVYGVDILGDNIVESKARMLHEIIDNKKLCERLEAESEDDITNLIKSIIFVMDKNIILGNFLTCKTEGSSNDEIFIIDWKMDGETVNATSELLSTMDLDDDRYIAPYIQGEHYLKIHESTLDVQEEYDKHVEFEI